MRLLIQTCLLLALLGFVGHAVASGEEMNRAMDQFIRGTIADEMGDYYRAVFHYQEALRLDSTSAFVYVALAQDYALLGKPEAALALLDRALVVRENYVPALELKLVILRGTGEPLQAEGVLRELVKADPENVNYLRQLLGIDLELGKYDDADKVFSQIARVDSLVDLFSRQVIAVYLTAGETKRAIRLLESLIASDSTDASLLYVLGTSYLQTGDSLAGESLIEQANELDPAMARYWVARAFFALNRREYERTLTILDSALLHVDPQPPILNLQGTALNQLGRSAEAIEAFLRSLEMDSTSFGTMGTLALIYDGLDSLEEAVRWYERAIAASDSAAVYLNNLAYTYATRGINLEHARVLVLRALDADPENGAYLDTMGWIEFGLGRYRPALKWLKKALRAINDDATTMEHVGDTYRKLGSRGKAQRYYREALKLNPDNESLLRKINE
ncbi:tetratricopeptide repeat protein [bacterium]|nr:tetratricopeptide repeat protein [bacterium]